MTAMGRTNRRPVGRVFRSVASLVVLVALTAWLMAPIGTTPGAPLRMVDAEGVDLGVAALTVSDGPERRWFELGDSALNQVPPRWLYLLGTFRMGRGQDDAKAFGIRAAEQALDVDNLEAPVGVSPWRVSGTSSGLAWALGTIVLNDPDLRNVQEIYATGALHGGDWIGRIDGLAAKLQTPDLDEAGIIFVPAHQYDEAISALRRIERLDIAERVVGVITIKDALAELCKHAPKASTCRTLANETGE